MSVFFTGFPGFLGSALLPRVLAREAGERAVCLVQPKYADAARRRLALLALRDPWVLDRVDLVEGDITLPDLALEPGDRRRVVEEARSIYHLAAVYDLAVAPAMAQRVNVDGTRHVLDLAESCEALDRLHYVSTCYVSGRYDGTFFEDDLETGHSFNNHYEETKHRAEVDVRGRMDRLPTTVYRPAIVVGDSRTGETDKYDGPYFFIKLLLRQPGVAVLPVVGRPDETRANIVPRDFIVDAISYLSTLPRSEGRTYHLADPAPPTIAEMLDVLEDRLEKRVLRVRMPAALARRALRLPGLGGLLDVPPQALDYFTHPTLYDTTHTRRDLEGSGITVPLFHDYADKLLAFVKDHQDVRSGAMA